MRYLLTLCLLAAGFGPSHAEPVRVESPYDVDTTVERLVDAVDSAGARVFATIPHSGGAASVGQELAPMQLVIFGNPKVGTAAMQADPLAGLVLPMRVLAYQDDDGQVWLVYQEPAEMLTRFDIPEDAPVIDKIAGALDTLTGKAVAAE